MRNLLIAFGLVGAVSAAACGSGSSTAASPTSPSTPAANTALTGSWVGTASDSTGTMMGAGMSPSMMGNMTWTITQSGTAFSGTMQFPGYTGGTMMVSGNMNGRTGTFTMTMPAGSMMAGGCSASATGTFDVNDMITQMHGAYAGSNTCGGPFDHGQMSMTKR